MTGRLRRKSWFGGKDDEFGLGCVEFGLGCVEFTLALGGQIGEIYQAAGNAALQPAGRWFSSLLRSTKPEINSTEV